MGKNVEIETEQNTAIFGAKNIDLLELCTTNNNHFGGTTAQRIGTKDTNNNDDDDDKKWGMKQQQNRATTHTHEATEENRCNTSQLQLQTKIKFIAKHYFNGYGFPFAERVDARFFFCFLIPNHLRYTDGYRF